MLYLHLKQDARFDYLSSGKFISKPGSVHPRRTMDEHVLLLGYKGTYPIRIGEREYTLGKGTFMLLPAGTEHAGTGECSEGQSHYWCHFRTGDGYANGDPVSKPGEYVIPEFGMTLSDQKLKIVFRQLIDCASEPMIPEFARRSECSAYLSILLTETALEFQRFAGKSDRSENRRAFVEYVREWIRVNAGEITAGDVAEAFPYNHDYLTRIFKTETGFTIAGYINECRIENVRKMLLETNLTVREIALSCGFGDEKQMMKLFRRKCDVTPSEYRRAFSMVHMNNE